MNILNWLEMLFLVNEEFNDSYLAENLYISFSKISALRADYFKVIEKIKVHNKIEIIISKEKKLPELHKEYVAIINADEKTYLIRLIIVKDTSLSDVLIYDLLDENDITKYKNIFFKEDDSSKISDEITSEINKISEAFVVVIDENNHLKMIGETSSFVGLLGYEDWDYNNKYENYLDSSILSEDLLKIKGFKEKESIVDIKFKCNGGRIITLNLEFRKRKNGQKDCYIIKRRER